MKITELEQMWWHRLSKVLYKIGGALTIVLSVCFIAIELNEAFRVDQRHVREAVDNIKDELIIIEDQLFNSGFDQIEKCLIKSGVTKAREPNSHFRPLFLINSLTDVFITVGLGDLHLDPQTLEEVLHRTDRGPESYIETKRKLLITMDCYAKAPNENGIAVIKTPRFSGSASIRISQLKRQLADLLDQQAVLHKASDSFIIKLVVQSVKNKAELGWLMLIPVYYIGLWFFYRKIVLYIIYGKLEV